MERTMHLRRVRRRFVVGKLGFNSYLIFYFAFLTISGFAQASGLC